MTRYPDTQKLGRLLGRLEDFARLKCEYGADTAAVEAVLADMRTGLEVDLARLLALPEDPELATREPYALEGIRVMRPSADRILWARFDAATYADRLAGAFFGRAVGCTLGVPVESWSIEEMRKWAEHFGDAFPPVDFWSAVKDPVGLHYGVTHRASYTRSGMDGVPVDDDLAYTLLGLLIAEESGLAFTTADVGNAWKRWLPVACTAEEVALENLRAGISAERAAEQGNPFVQWIGADIRSDPWGWLAPGQPEKAAGMAWHDARLSHRRNGIFGAMFFSAAISAAFATGDVVRALRLGLMEIPADCSLACDLRWALDVGRGLTGHADARAAVDERFAGMSSVHTNNNACLTVFGLMIGGRDFTRVIGETIAMGLDNDCTAATAGSLFGASYGLEAIPAHWYAGFGNRMQTYLTDIGTLSIDDVLRRFARLAEAGFESRTGT